MSAMLNLSEVVLAFLKKERLTGVPGVVAVSGGPDSVALARLVVELGQRGQAAGVTLAHLNHQLRGEESDADRSFVEELGQRLGVPVRTQAIDVRAVAQQSGENLEDAARRLRYDWLAQLAREVGAGWVATGHTADDQAETVLHRLLRGAGLQGLGGMPPRRTLASGVDLLRPLLAVRRQEVLALLEETGQSFRADSSNLDRRFTRNRIRHELLPRLVDSFNPAIVEILNRLAVQAREAQQVLAGLAAQLLTQAERPRAAAVLVLSLAPLEKAAGLIVREMFRLLWRRENWPQGDMTAEHWERLEALARGAGTALDLPGGVHVRRVRGVVQIGRRK